MCADISADMSANIAVYCQPSLDRYSTDTRSTYLPCIDRLSVEYRSRHRPISRSMCRPMYRSRPPKRYMVRFSYTSPKGMLGKLDTSAACNTTCLHFMKCRASQFYRQNIAPIASFRSQISSKLPWQVLESTHRTAREATSLMNNHVSIHIVLTFQSPSNHLSLLVCLYPPFKLHDASLGVSAMENGSKNTYKPKTYQI